MMETKPGQHTTEFWVMIYVQVMQFLNLVGIWDFVPNKYSTWIMGGVTFGYAVARGIAKSGVKPS
jgi:hypothetical protein